MTDNFQTPLDWKSEVWWRKRSADERVFHCHVPPRIASTIDVDKLPLVGDPSVNMLFMGPSGSGKSQRAAGMLMSVVHEKELSGRWVEADDYVEMLKDSFNNDGLLPEMYSSPHLIKYIKGVFDVVVLDGLGDERLTEFAAHELGSLIRKRYDKNKTTFLTSRLSLVDIKNRYGSRLASVLADFHVVRP